MTKGQDRPLSPWRQGSIVDPEWCVSKGYLTEQDAKNGSLLLVVTHDCDLQSSPANEPTVELLVAVPGDQNHDFPTNGKNARRLGITHNDGTRLHVHRTKRVELQKEELFEQTPQGSLDDRGRRLLADWLSYRYRRAAFPDSLNARLKHAKTLPIDKLDGVDASKLGRTRNLAKELEKAFKKYGDPIEGVYLSLQGNEHNELPSETPYLATIAIVAAASTLTDETCIQSAEKLATIVRQLIDYAVWDNDFGRVNLQGCTGSTELEFPLFFVRRMLRWHLDWLSA